MIPDNNRKGSYMFLIEEIEKKAFSPQIMTNFPSSFFISYLVRFVSMVVIAVSIVFNHSLPSAIADDTTDIRIGVTAPLTGDYGSAGQEIQRGIELATERLRGEQIGVKVTFEDACLPAPAVSALKKMMERDRIEALVANYCVIALNALRPIVDKQGLLTFQNSSAPTSRRSHQRSQQ
jgi:ABC-type branched-subunit amino acid transport system substrate-binding protein